MGTLGGRSRFRRTGTGFLGYPSAATGRHGPCLLHGPVMDVNDATLLGENALAYVLLSYFAITFHRRVLWFPLKKQIWYILILLLSSQLVQMFIQFIVSHRTSSWLYLIDSGVGALLWPLVTMILLAPQRRSVDTDLDRPL